MFGGTWKAVSCSDKFPLIRFENSPGLSSMMAAQVSASISRRSDLSELDTDGRREDIPLFGLFASGANPFCKSPYRSADVSDIIL